MAMKDAAQKPRTRGTAGKAVLVKNSNQPDKAGRQKDDSWVSSLAILGDSWGSLVVSLLLLMSAIVISLGMEGNENSTIMPRFFSSIFPKTTKDDDPYSRLGPVPHMDPPKIFVYQQDEDDSLHQLLEAYAKDGVVMVRGLVSDNLLEALDRESALLVTAPPTRKTTRRKKKTQFHTVLHGAIFRNHDDSSTSAFWNVSLDSPVPSLAAKLLQREANSTKNLRVMRDILLAKDDDEYVCGWHVDDLGFWPATPDAPGINAWIALDDMPVEYGGGFAVAVGSHQATWRQEAHHVTGASTTFPSGGYTSAADMFSKRTGSGTCNLHEAAPHLHRRMEETKRVYEVQRGDVIFHTRWLFHRTVPFERSYVAQKKKPLVYRRYSIRYSPGSATIPPGYGTEWSVLWDAENGGRTADEACQRDGPWYPQAWPSSLESERTGLVDLVREKVPVAEERRSLRQQEMKPFLKQMAQQQQRAQKATG